MIDLSFLKECLVKDTRAKNIPKQLLEDMIELEFKTDSRFPIPIDVYKCDDKYLICAYGSEFHLEPYEAIFHRSPTVTKMQATPYFIENVELRNLCAQYINTAEDSKIAARHVLEAQYYILDHIYKHREEGTYESTTSYLYPLYEQRKNLLMFEGTDDELRHNLFVDACWLFDEYDRLEAIWCEHDASIYEPFEY